MDKQLKKDIREFQNLAKQFSSSAEVARGLTEAAAVNMKKINDLSKQNTAEAAKEKRFREDIKDLSKDILENTGNIGTEEFKILDVAKRLAKARRMGDKELVKQLTHLKSINQQQKQQQKQLEAISKIARKPFEAIDGFIREIPIVGDLLAETANFSGLGDSFANGIVEGATSGLVEGFGGKAFKGVKSFFTNGVVGGVSDGLKDSTSTAVVKSSGLSSVFAELNASTDNLKHSSAGFLDNIVLLRVAGVAAAAVMAKMAASAISFANSTGIAYRDVLAMGPSLLVNADAVNAFAEELGTINNLTFMQSVELKKQQLQFGLQARDAAKLFAIQRGIEGATMDTFLASTKVTAELARQEGVAPAKLFEDMAQNAEAIAFHSRGSTEEMEQAAINAQKMGTSLAMTTRIAENLSDFQSSVSNEMTVQTLFGKSINLQRARELMFAGKTNQMQEEVLNQVRALGDFTQMDFVRKKAIMNLTGMTADELVRQQSAQESVNKAAEDQKSTLMGSMLAGAAIGAVLVGAFTAAGSALIGSLSLGALAGAAAKGGIEGATKGFGAGVLAGGALGGIGGAMIDKGMVNLPGLATGGDVKATGAAVVHRGESVGNLAKVEKRLSELVTESKLLREQNEFLMGRLTNKVNSLGLSS